MWWVMGKTADLTVVRMTTTKPQKVSPVRTGCLQNTVLKHIYGKLTGREQCGMKRCTSNTDDRNLVRIITKLVKEHDGASELSVAGNIALRATMHRYIQQWATSVRFLVSSHF